MLLRQMTFAQIDALSRDLPVLIPIAAIEQHAAHLPVATDSLLLEEIVRKVELQVPERVLVTPLQWLGNSHHHLDFPGTMSAEPRVYLDLLCGLLNNFLYHGFRRLLLLNGHGGNDTPGKQAIYEVRQQQRQRSDLLLLFATYWGLGESTTLLPDLVQTEMGHACEWETSMMLAIDPGLVGDYHSLETVEFGRSFRPATRAWITQERSPAGYIGCPQQASAAKGHELLNRFTGDVLHMIDRMQHWNGTSWEG